MTLKVVVWGTGNVGRPAIRAVLSHRDLELVGVIVANTDKVGLDAGEIAGVGTTGVIATDDWRSVLDAGADAVIYTATADIRPVEAMGDLLACLSAGINVVSSAFYVFLHPQSTPQEAMQPVSEACAKSGASLFVSGIDPGWVMDMLPVVLSGAVSGIREIRTREIFNYALYDQPQVVREVIGFGGPMETLPLMLHDFAIEMVWAPMVRLVAEAMGKPVEKLTVKVERLPLERTIDVPGMGTFEAGTQGAFRFEVLGYHGEQPLYALEHVTRIDDECAPHWPYPPEGRGCHQVIIKGDPDLHVSVHAQDHHEPGAAGGGNASAANWLVNAVPAVCSARAGVVTVLDLPRITGPVNCTMDNAGLNRDAPAANEGVAEAVAETSANAARAANKNAPQASRGRRLARLAGTHALVLLLALSAFAAADSWNTVTGLGIAGLLCFVTAALAGVTTATLVHEWFHYLGARYCGAQFDLPSRPGLFVFNWDFGSNSVRQFLVMSVAGSVGGILSVLLLWQAVPADSWGRAALRGAAIASVVYAALIEWPVIRRVRRGGDPLAELSKIDKALLSRSFLIAGVSGIVTTSILVS